MSIVASKIGQQRLHYQGITDQPFETPGEVVAWLGALQAQDYLGALWSVGLRMLKATDQMIEQAIADKTIIRTWPMRGTLHFVAPADVRWMQALLTPRVIANSARRYAELGLEQADFARSQELFAHALQGGKPLTRQAMLDLLEQGGITIAGQRGYHLLGWAAQKSLICFGPMQGKQPTFVWLDDWIPASKPLTREEALATLAQRYFTGHGPATLQDFIWWTGLPTADARVSIEMAKAQLTHEVVDGQTYWLAQTIAPSRQQSPAAYLLPGFDEYLLGYTNRSAVLDPIYHPLTHPGNNGIFSSTVVIDGRVVGVWKRTLKKKSVIIKVQPFTAFTAEQDQAIATAAQRYGEFLGLSVTLG
ncbi:MAG: winged helix DNA-binding domain-containing protein [Chloroflexi bacterium]|nr:winged helix DNA-binding domain-containing protein [Chloroflexota bacterium]